MKTLVIGGTGLISGAITKELVRQGHEVAVFHRGHKPLRESRVLEILGDRRDRKMFEAAMHSLRVDAVFDLISFTREDAESAFRAFKGRVKHFIHCSTVCAVGVPTTKIVCDENEPYRPISSYGRGKAAGEKFLLSAWRRCRFPVTIFRPSHTYGPGGGWVLGTFLTDWETDCELLNRIREGKPVVVHGDGENLWQSCYSEDAAKGFVGALGKSHVKGQIYNVCGGEILTWNQYYEKVGKAVGRKPKIVHLPSELIMAAAPASATGFLGEIARFHGAYSIEKIRKHIPEFKPTIDVARGTRLHMQWLASEGRLAKAPARPWEDRLARLGIEMKRKALRLGRRKR